MVITMSEKNGATKPKDFWDKLDVVGKLLAALAVSAGIGYYGIYSENRRFEQTENNRKAQADEGEKNRVAQDKQSEKNRRIQSGIQILSNREAVLADMRTKMFGDLIQHYVKGQDPKSKIVIVELMAVNFQDLFQLRPLFDDLDATLRPASKERKELRRVAKNVISRQINTIVGSGGSVCELELEINKTMQADCVPLLFKLIKTQEDRIRVSGTPEDKNGFEVSYFDMPFADYSKKGELRYSVVLSSTGKENAKVKVVVFPRHYFSGESRLVHDQLIGEYFFEDYKGPDVPSVKENRSDGDGK